MPINIEKSCRAAISFIPWLVALLGAMGAIFASFPENVIAGVSCVASVALIVAQLKYDAIQKAKRETPPDLDAEIVRGPEGYLVAIKSRNLIPFRAKWLVVTRNDKVVSGVPLGFEEVHPTPDRKDFLFRTHLQEERIKEGYLALRLDFHSLHAAELDDPRLKGKIRKEYQMGEIRRLVVKS